MKSSEPKQSGLKVWFLTSGRSSPSSRYRVFQYLPHLRADGFRCTVANSFPDKYEYFPLIGWRLSRLLKRLVRRWHLLRMRWSRPDVVVLERELFDEPTMEFEEQLRGIARRLLLDVDDAVFLRYPEKFARLPQICDGIIVGNQLLKEHLATLNPNAIVIPTCVDIDFYPQRPPATVPSTRTVIGWIGTPSNLPQLEIVLPALRSVAQQASIELRIISSQRDCLDRLDTQGINVRFIPWRASTAVRELHQCDIGIMPLHHDDPWNHYKCGLKLIEYMAIGIPAVASSVGVNSQIVTSGVDGFLADSSSGWFDSLSRLVADVPLRNHIGLAARQTVIERYSVQANLPKLAQALRDVAR